MPATARLRGAVLIVALAAIGLSGCGRRGPLEPAADSGISAKQARDQTPKPEPGIGALDAPRRIPNVVPPKGPFVLDPLL